MSWWRRNWDIRTIIWSDITVYPKYYQLCTGFLRIYCTNLYPVSLILGRYRRRKWRKIQRCTSCAQNLIDRYWLSVIKLVHCIVYLFLGRYYYSDIIIDLLTCISVFTSHISLFMKTTLLSLIRTLALLGIVWTSTLAFAYAQADFPYDNIDTSNPTIDVAQEINNDVIDDSENQGESLITKLTNIFGLERDEIREVDTGDNGRTFDRRWTNYISFVINVALALMAFIALVVLIYGFFTMFFAKKEEWLAKAKKILINTTIAIIIIAISRFVVSFLFNVFTQVRDVT